jgi:penicillin-binding protein 1C
MGGAALKVRRLLQKRRWRWACLLLAPLGFAWLLDVVFPLHLPGEEALYSRLVVDRHGRPLRAFPDDRGVWRYQVNLDQVSPLYLQALLTYEDRRFWFHPGVDPVALVRALAGNLRHGRTVSGGSTITMQVARLLHPHSRSLPSKLQQLFRALQLEWHLDKSEILNLYCNIAPFGGTIEGVQAASFTYLNKPASDLTHAEAALLAVLPQSPTRYRPDLNPTLAQAARNKVLDRLVSFEHWSPELVEQAKLEPVYAIRNQLETRAALLAERLIRRNPSRVVQSTIDRDLQSALEDYVKHFISTQPERTSAAVLVVDNASAEVRAYLGAADFGNPARFGHVDMVGAQRSPGSTLKPFLYGLALDAGLIHSHSLLVDAPLQWQSYQPGNFSGSFSGPVSATAALQRSLNVPAVDLLDHYGPENFVDRLTNAGLPLSIPQGKASLAVILGGAGARLEDLVAAYGAFANGGQVRSLRLQPQERESPGNFLLSHQAAWVVYDMLAGVERPDGLRRISALASRPTLAWKTGTSYGMRDAWAIGVDRNHTIGVWIGRPDNSALPGNTGRDAAGPLLHAIADHLGVAPALARPEGVEQEIICWPLGTKVEQQPTDFCHKRLSAWIIQDTVPPTWPDRQNPLAANPLSYWVDRTINKRLHTTCLTGDYEQRQAAVWPSALETWLPIHWRRSHQLPPLARECAAMGNNPVRIEQLASDRIYRKAGSAGSAPEITLMASGGEGRYHWYLNGVFQHSSPPIHKLALTQPGEQQILVVDDAGNLDKVEIRVH